MVLGFGVLVLLLAEVANFQLAFLNISKGQKKGKYPWIQGWIKSIKEILRKALIQGKQQLLIPLIEEEVKKVKETIVEAIPQLTKEDREKLNELNDKIQSFLKSPKIRYWIKDKKTKKITDELKEFLKKTN